MAGSDILSRMEQFLAITDFFELPYIEYHSYPKLDLQPRDTEGVVRRSL